ncbi:Asp23/Gls24 family envelope stress response protein [Luedemannella helvata]|uniref:Asp23/Gls24 family envelope stress response protein n=1 Tax=Luedemannella helvata TaxID=349315 RepID=A0ABN2K720_9ACTN
MSETDTAAPSTQVEVVDGAQQTAAEFADRARETATEYADKARETAGEYADKARETAERVSAATGRITSDLVERMRNNAELTADRGTTTIANEVVEKIAAIAAREVPGVYDLGGDVARLFASVKERIGFGRDKDGGESADQGVKVRLEGRQATVTVTLVIEYGFVVHSVTDSVRMKVIGAVENLLGLEVTACDIVVDDVHVPDKGPVGDDESRAPEYH